MDNSWTQKVPYARATYENGGWKDGRIGQAYDLISAVLTDRGVPTHRNDLLAEIEEMDAALQSREA